METAAAGDAAETAAVVAALAVVEEIGPDFADWSLAEVVVVTVVKSVAGSDPKNFDEAGGRRAEAGRIDDASVAVVEYDKMETLERSSLLAFALTMVAVQCCPVPMSTAHFELNQIVEDSML